MLYCVMYNLSIHGPATVLMHFCLWFDAPATVLPVPSTVPGPRPLPPPPSHVVVARRQSPTRATPISTTTAVIDKGPPHIGASTVRTVPGSAAQYYTNDREGRSLLEQPHGCTYLQHTPPGTVRAARQSRLRWPTRSPTRTPPGPSVQDPAPRAPALCLIGS